MSCVEGQSLPTLLREEDKALVLEMNGDLSVADAAEMKRQLIEGMSSPKLLQIDASAANDLDITIIQLLWALSADAERTGKELGLRGAVPTGVASAIAEAGLPNFLSKYGPDAAPQSARKAE